MRRTKEWWAVLTAYERSRLWWLERAEGQWAYSPFLPFGYGECPMCSEPTSGDLCMTCLKELIRLTHKPVRLLIRKRAYEIAAQNGWTPRRAKYLARTGGRRYIRAVAKSPKNLKRLKGVALIAWNKTIDEKIKAVWREFFSSGSD